MKARHQEAGCDVSIVTILRVLGVERTTHNLCVRTRPMDEFSLDPRPVSIESVCTPPAGLEVKSWRQGVGKSPKYAVFTSIS